MGSVKTSDGFTLEMEPAVVGQPGPMGPTGATGATGS